MQLEQLQSAEALRLHSYRVTLMPLSAETLAHYVIILLLIPHCPSHLLIEQPHMVKLMHHALAKQLQLCTTGSPCKPEHHPLSTEAAALHGRQALKNERFPGGKKGST